MQKLLTLFLALSPALTLFSQGCSDAGFCTVGSLKSPDSDTAQPTTFNQLKIGLSLGRADYEITTVASFLEYNRQFGKYWSASAKLTQLAQSGNGISVNGLSDVFLTGVYNPRKLAYTLGIKVPLTDGNRSYNGQPLPLDYQSSLGTLDLIAGISRKWSNFRLTAAIQQPLAQNNNRFFPMAHDSASVLFDIPATNGFHRKGDVLLRATYDFAAGKHWKLIPGLLPIFHLGEDTYLDASGSRETISGSSGLTLNGTLFVHYAFNEHHKLEASFGTPFVARTVRPDGLTRKYVFGVEYRFGF
jgi:hypothetical protein